MLNISKISTNSSEAKRNVKNCQGLSVRKRVLVKPHNTAGFTSGFTTVQQKRWFTFAVDTSLVTHERCVHKNSECERVQTVISDAVF